MTEAQAYRLFIAIELPESVKAALVQAMDDLKRDLHGPYRWVSPANLHLTLKFLGNVDPARVEALVQAMAVAGNSVPPLALRLGGAGTFPPGRRIAVVWAGLGGDLDTLSTLQALIESAMAEQGFEPEGRAFRPHLTLARVRDRLSLEQTQALRDRLASVRYADEAPFRVSSLALIRSELGRGGARYTTLGTAELGG